jgi:nucleotide-binding universal stress UspA family protein
LEAAIMYRRILVAVDSSATAERALQEALKLAKSHQAQLRIVHVVDEVTLDWNYSDFADVNTVHEQFRKTGRKVLEKALQSARQGGNVAVETKLLEIQQLGHNVADLIAAEADAWPADVIVVGTHGRRGVRRLLLGSVAEGVARIASKQVLLIRGE